MLIDDEILCKVGAYVLGNVVISVIAAVGTFMWLELFGGALPVARCCSPSSWQYSI